MDKNEKKKVLGGTEKLRLRRKRELESVARTCHTIDKMFKIHEDMPSSTASTSSLIHPELEKIEIDHVQQNKEKEKTNEEKENTNNAFFRKPHNNNIEEFFNYHPKQPVQNVPFNNKIYFRKHDQQNRQWLSFCEDNNKLYCSICLAYGGSNENIFTKGFSNWDYVHQYIERHETSKFHDENVMNHFMRSKNTLNITTQFRSLRKENIMFNRNVLTRVINVIKLIGKRGLSYRGKRNESLYTFDDDNVDHGTFIEIIILLSKYDDTLKNHLRNCIEKSKKIHECGKRQGRGNLISFLSKTTVNYVIEAISQLIKNKISQQINDSGMYSIQIDTTQDVSVQDQCVVVVRYINNNNINERLLSTINMDSSTGESFYNVVKELLEINNIDITKCIGNSTDGASNMQGKYQGFSAHMLKSNAENVHVWCYAHILNLVISDITQSSITVATLFNLLNLIAVFIRESYIRMNMWNYFNKDNKRKKLNIIGETRWWAKDAILKKIFGNYNNPKDGLFVELILTLNEISLKPNFKAEIRQKAKYFIDSLTKYETILTAKLFLKIFEITTPISNYLQEKGLDFIKAYNMISCAIQSLKEISRNFCVINEVSDEFVNYANNNLDEMECDVMLESKLPEIRRRQKKIMPGEKALDETTSNALKNFEVNVYNFAIDMAVQSMENRFSKNQSFYYDIGCLDPKNFTEPTPSNAFEKLSSVLIKFNPIATKQNLIEELNNFKKNWNLLKENVNDSFRKVSEDNVINDSDDDDNDDDNDKTISPSHCGACKNCPICCYNILQRYNMLSGTYATLGQAYKYLLTLSVTQVSCERSFSILKYIKNRLRSTMSQENLDAFMLMAVEKDLLNSIDSDDVINLVAKKSNLLFEKLML
ncbi:uncharacterized protein LOC124815047 [Hydra vulgaris]|uniref:uncharacterized protein LOC124815047 n=1 Tax=Hydra vulgaris TaxID=6087 RepID=UPI0032E9F9C6